MDVSLLENKNILRGFVFRYGSKKFNKLSIRRQRSLLRDSGLLNKTIKLLLDSGETLKDFDCGLFYMGYITPPKGEPLQLNNIDYIKVLDAVDNSIQNSLKNNDNSCFIKIDKNKGDVYKLIANFLMGRGYTIKLNNRPKHHYSKSSYKMYIKW